MSKTIFEKTYDGESIVDAFRDVSEAFDARFTPEVADIPTDEYGFQQGSFKITITWSEDE